MKTAPKHMSRWSAADCLWLETLASLGMTAKEIGTEMGRTARAVSNKAGLLEISLGGQAAQAARQFLNAGGVILREEVQIGADTITHWASAHRSSKVRFSPILMEHLIKTGQLVNVLGSQNLFRKKQTYALGRPF